MKTLTNLIQSSSFEPDILNKYSAWVGHIPFANFLVKDTKPQNIVELGSHWGYSYFAFCKTVIEEKIDCQCFAVDTWEGDLHAGLYGNEIYNFVDNHNKSHYRGISSLMRMTFDEASRHFENDSIDILHIDGLHTYDAVKNDYQIWLPKIKKGGYILFHDTAVKSNEFGVWKLWDEISSKHPYKINFIHSHGLGVVQVNESKDLAPIWLNQEWPMFENLVKYFKYTGMRHEITQDKYYIKSSEQKIKSKFKDMQNSLSWKVTAPFRNLANILNHK
jgi:hypothetical protein